MGKYDDAIGGVELKVSVTEILNEDSANKVDERIKKQKAELSEPVEIDVKVDDKSAIKKLEALDELAKSLKNDLNDAITSKKSLTETNKLLNKYQQIDNEVKKLSNDVDKGNKSLKNVQQTLKENKKIIDSIAISEEKITKTRTKRSSGGKKTNNELPSSPVVTEDLEKVADLADKTADKLAKVEEITNRISKNSSIKGIKNLAHEAVEVTKLLDGMYEDGIRDTERYITLQYKLSKIFDKMGKSYGKTLASAGVKDKSELRDMIFDTISQQTGVNLIDSYGSLMENLLGDSDFSLFNKSLSKLRMQDIAELLIATGKTGDWDKTAIPEVKEVQKLTSSYKGLAEAVQEFSDINKKVWSAYIHNSLDYKQLEQERENSISKIRQFFPEGTAHRFAIDSGLKRSELKNATAKDLLGYVETNLGKANQENILNKISQIYSKYGAEDATALFGNLPDFEPNFANIAQIYDNLIAKEQEYLESGAKSISAFKERNKFLEQSVELTEKLKNNEQFMQQRNDLLGMVTEGIHTSESALKLLTDAISPKYVPVLPNGKENVWGSITDIKQAREYVRNQNGGFNVGTRLEFIGVEEIKNAEELDDITKQYNARRQQTQVILNKEKLTIEEIVYLLKEYNEMYWSKLSNPRLAADAVNLEAEIEKKFGRATTGFSWDNYLNHGSFAALDGSKRPDELYNQIATTIVKKFWPIIEQTSNVNETVSDASNSLRKEIGETADSFDKASKVIMGNAGQTFAGKQPINFKYAVMSVEDLVMSHDAYGHANANYPTELQPRDRSRLASREQILQMANALIPSLLAESATAQNGSPIVGKDGVVVGGNARSAAILEAYKNGRADGYKSYIMENAAQFGLNPNNIPNHPVLVRVVDIDGGLDVLAKQLNETTTAGYSTTEQALVNEELVMKVISKLNLDESANLNAEANKGFIKAFIGQLSDGQKNEMVTKDGSLSAVGLAKTRQAIAGAAYGSRDMLENLEQISPELINISNALMAGAAKAADIRYQIESNQLNDLGVVSTLLKGVDLLKTARGNGGNIDDYLAQGSLLGSDYAAEDVAIGKFLEANVRNAANLRNMIDTLLNFARSAGDPNQLSFGGLGDITLSDVVRNAFSKYAETYQKQIDYNSLVDGYLPAEAGSRSDKRVDRTAEQSKLIEAESQLGDAIDANIQKKQTYTSATKDATEQTRSQKSVEDAIDDEVSQPEAVPIIQKQIEDALVQIREAKNILTIKDLFGVDLSTVSSDDDGPYSKELEKRIGQLVSKAMGERFEAKNVHIKDGIANVVLKNEELGVVTQQMWRLEKATEDATEARLKFVKVTDLDINFEQAEKFAKAQEDALNKSEKQIIQYQKRLNDATLKYQHGNKKLDGNNLQLIDPSATSLKDSVDPTIDDLASHIQQRLNDSLGTVISNATKNEIERDLNALLNNIKIQQADKYKSGRMSDTEVVELRNILVDTLDTAAARARKGNVFDAISESYNQLKNNLTDNKLSTYFTDENIDDAVQKVRTFGAEVTKAMAIGSEQKKANQDLQNALNIQERLYAAKKKLAEFEVKGDMESSDALAAQRKVDALQEQLNLSKQLLTSDTQKNKLAEQEVQLNRELEIFQNEQLNNAIKQIGILEDKVATQVSAWSQNKTMEFLPKSLQSEINQFQSSLSTLDENSDLQQIEQRWNDITNKVKAATKANQEYVNSYYKNEFQNNYQYTGGKTAADQQTLDSMADYYRQEEQSAQQFNDNIKSIYNQLISTFKQINDLDAKINNLSFQDGGSGFYAKTIESLQTKKSSLVADVRAINEEITKSLTLDATSGQSGLAAFFEDARVQATLTSEEIQKFGDILRQADEIKFNFGAKLSEQIQPVIEKIANLKQMIIDGDISSDSQMAKNILNIDADIASKVSQFKADPSAASAVNVLKAIEVYSDYLNTIDKATQKEKAYFANKQEYVSGFNLENQAINQATKETEELLDVRKKLEGAAQDFAKNGAFITNFTQNADGISRLDFSVFDSATSSMRNFTMEMGNASQKMFVTETTIKKSLANIQAAQKQLQSTTSLLGKLGESGINVAGDNTTPQQVQNLISLYKRLDVLLSQGDKADQTKITKLTSDLKIASGATERLYKQMIQMQSAIESGQAKQLGVGDPTGNVYNQLVENAQQLISTQQGVTLEIGHFDKATNTLEVSLGRANGTVETFKLQMNQLNGQMTQQQAGTKKLTNSWDQFKTSLASAGKQLTTAFVGYNVFYKVMSAIRTGITYVKEIDLAMTELKKVTDETEESYAQFLNTAADTAGKIGSTLSDFTEATANFARLGYTMEESANMAETAIVYKNVADGIDNVEEATDSIISTMKAFGIEANNTMQIVDIFNEVGNNFAITSAGIGEAMQRSASALYAAGNTIEESTALITAANSV